jgi:hypothetical protein
LLDESLVNIFLSFECLYRALVTVNDMKRRAAGPAQEPNLPESSFAFADNVER